jgi:hypothetical protein
MPAFTLCADFTLFPVTSPPTTLPPLFTLAGFTFQQLGGPSPWPVNSLNGCQGLQVAAAGPTPQEMQINLPVPVSTVSLRIGNVGQPVDIAALDSSGNTVKTMTIPNLTNLDDKCVNTSIQAPEISSVVLTSQDFESILERICEAICCP